MCGCYPCLALDLGILIDIGFVGLDVHVADDILAVLSEFSEAYVVPGDISSKGCDFLAEAERLKGELPMQPSLAALQGTLLMYERYVELVSVL